MKNTLAKSFFDRVRVGVSSHLDLSHLAEWIELNTTHPKDDNKQWDFQDHEYQRDILNDAAPRVIVRKCSQVGLSELSVRMVVAMAGIYRNHTAIYTLPTSDFAVKFCKQRFDPVIKSSKILKEMLNRDVDNASQKQIGSFFLFIIGTYAQRSAISIPADILVMDEVDFSNQTALTTFSSRLGHAKDGGIRREFSTPTVNGFGISRSFDTSSQAYYGVKHNACGQVVFPNFLQDVVIPGYDESIERLEREDLRDPRYSIGEAFLKCPSCGKRISQENLATPDKRQWVHKYPDQDTKGYQIFPYDVPVVNPIPKTLMQLEEYERRADFINFKVGLPFEDAESSFLEDVVNNSVTGFATRPPAPGQEVEVSKYNQKGFILGCDVGKTSWIMVGKPTDRKIINVVWMERVRQDGENSLLKRLVFLTSWFGVSKAVIDAGPDFSTSMAYVESYRMGRTYANYYTRSKSRASLSTISINEEEGIVTSARTETLDDLVKQINSGRMVFPRVPEIDTMKEHMRSMKRVEQLNNQGDTVANWVSTGPDHYCHALNYMKIAGTLLDTKYNGDDDIIAVLPMAGAARLKNS